MSDKLIHVHMGGGHYSPCGVRVSTSKINEPIGSSCGDDYSKVTCTVCKALVARMARHYRKATRCATKWNENPAKNV